MAEAKKPAAKKAAPKVTAPVAEAPAPKAPKWEYKDRLYELTSQRRPLVFTIPSMHSQLNPLLYFDEEKGYNREL